MCGIAGFLENQPGDLSGRHEILAKMAQTLAHRGPDAEGMWQTADGRVNIAHRRLSIVDLSETGSQPMRTPDARYILSYNGEIYNAHALRSELAQLGWVFRGTSDTEVLLYALAHWGVEATLPRLNGMFAFALWDEGTRELWLARDRFGEKPLFYAWQNGVFFFGSELKAFAPHPSFRREINREALSQFLRFNYVPWPLCIFRDAWKLGPGHCLRVKLGQTPGAARPYWRLADTIAQRQLLRVDADDPQLIDELDRMLRRSVGARMVADVPLGAFLSGGIDSSTIVALMQAQSSRPIKTFTIGFWEAAYNEAEDAGRVARHLGTEHYEIYLSLRECMEAIELIPKFYDEPFADSSQIPTALISQFTRRHVTVALSGDAGDEMFGGYNRYFWSSRVWPKLSRMPVNLRRQLALGIQSYSPAYWDRWFALSNAITPSRLHVRGGGEKLHKLAMAMDAKSADELYRGFVAQWRTPSDVLTTASDPTFFSSEIPASPDGLNDIEQMMYWDAMTYLPSDILCKVDRASMASGLEARVPFLDNELVAFAWSLPLEVKIRGGVGKWPLRRLLSRYIPPEMFERPKTGFGIPIGDWMRGLLRDWTDSMLSESRLRADGFFKPEVVRQQWNEHLSGKYNRQHSLWSILMFQSWHSKWCR